MRELTAQDLVIGEKYIPIKKSVQDFGPLESSGAWHRALREGQPYLFYKGISNHRHVFSMNAGENGDYFLPSDVIPYIEPSTDTYDVFGADSELQQEKSISVLTVQHLITLKPNNMNIIAYNQTIDTDKQFCTLVFKSDEELNDFLTKLATVQVKTSGIRVLTMVPEGAVLTPLQQRLIDALTAMDGIGSSNEKQHQACVDEATSTLQSILDDF